MGNKEFSKGDNVIITKAKDRKYEGRIGTIADISGEEYGVKMKDPSNGELLVLWVNIENIEPYHEKSDYEKRFCDLVDEIRDTFIKKNRDYGNSFSDSIKKFGLNVAVARIHDKYMRVENMAIGKKMNINESMRDNLLDISVYCLLTVLEIDSEDVQTSDFDV